MAADRQMVAGRPLSRRQTVLATTLQHLGPRCPPPQATPSSESLRSPCSGEADAGPTTLALIIVGFFFHTFMQLLDLVKNNGNVPTTKTRFLYAPVTRLANYCSVFRESQRN